MEAKGQLVTEITVGLNRFGQAERDLVGHLGNGVSSSSQKEFFQAQRFDEGFAFQEQADPFKQEEAAVQITALKALQDPTSGLDAALVSDHGA